MVDSAKLARLSEFSHRNVVSIAEGARKARRAMGLRTARGALGGDEAARPDIARLQTGATEGGPSEKRGFRDEAGRTAAQSQSQKRARIWTMADKTNSNLTPEQMAARIAELEGRLAKGGDISFKVSEKGGCFSVWSRSIPGHPLLGAMGRIALPRY